VSKGRQGKERQANADQKESKKEAQCITHTKPVLNYLQGIHNIPDTHGKKNSRNGRGRPSTCPQVHSNFGNDEKAANDAQACRKLWKKDRRKGIQSLTVLLLLLHRCSGVTAA